MFVGSDGCSGAVGFHSVLMCSQAPVVVILLWGFEAGYFKGLLSFSVSKWTQLKLMFI